MKFQQKSVKTVNFSLRYPFLDQNKWLKLQFLDACVKRRQGL